jgi:circadian clock protein KaiC
LTRPRSPPTSPRLTTGLAELDLVLNGGLLESGSYIVQGAPGAGKTILGNQMCFHHVASGKQAVYVTLLTESHARMFSHLRQMSFFKPELISESLHYVSGYPALRTGNLRGLVALLHKVIKRHKASLVVIDGLARAGAFANTSVEFKQFVHELNALLEFSRCTAVLLTDSTSEALGYPARTMVDGLIELNDSMEGLRAVRELLVTKSRGGPFLRGVHFFEITGDGIRLYPRLEARLAAPSRELVASEKRMSLGVPGLDRMTGGGLPEGTSTLVAGSTGTGKTLLGLHFLAAGFAAGERSLYFGFYESPARLLRKGDDLGLRLTEHRAAGLFDVAWQSAGELIMDALAERLLDQVEKSGIRRLVLDGLTGFEESLVKPDRLPHFFKALTNELRARGVTTLVTCDAPSGAETPAFGLASEVENIILLRQSPELSRSVAVIKTRESAHDQEPRGLTITSGGLRIAGTAPARKRIKGRAP